MTKPTLPYNVKIVNQKDEPHDHDCWTSVEHTVEDDAFVTSCETCGNVLLKEAC
jgi:hypothetical protein